MDGYRVVKNLGEGGFGQVVLAQHRTTKQVSGGVSEITTGSAANGSVGGYQDDQKKNRQL